MKKYLLIYHKEDNDGVFSAAIILNYLITHDIARDEINLIDADYNLMNYFQKNNTPKKLHERYNTIILTDISFTADYMHDLYNEFAHNMIWFDHHAPIINESLKVKNGFDCEGVRNISKSAILCAYEYFYDPFNEKYNQIDTNKPITELHREFPEFFRILSAWDSWSYEREGYTHEWVRHINKGTTVEFNLNIDKVLETVQYIIGIYHNGLDIQFENILIGNMYKRGQELNDYEDITIENIIKYNGDCSWNIVVDDADKGRPFYRKACAIFHEGQSNSLMFKCLQNKDIKNGLVFKHQSNGNWVLSMYNVNNDDYFHCGEFLKEKYNGGGHKGAAGCTFTEDQFIEILKKRQL